MELFWPAACVLALIPCRPNRLAFNNAMQGLQFDEDDSVHPTSHLNRLWSLVVSLAGQIQGTKEAKRATGGFLASAKGLETPQQCLACVTTAEAIRPFDFSFHVGKHPAKVSRRLPRRAQMQVHPGRLFGTELSVALLRSCYMVPFVNLLVNFIGYIVYCL